MNPNKNYNFKLKIILELRFNCFTSLVIHYAKVQIVLMAIYFPSQWNQRITNDRRATEKKRKKRQQQFLMNNTHNNMVAVVANNVEKEKKKRRKVSIELKIAKWNNWV